MRAFVSTFLIFSLGGVGLALADEPTPAPVPAPDQPAPPPEEPKPDAPKPDTPTAPPPTPVPEEPKDKPGVNIPSTTQEGPTSTAPRAFDDMHSGGSVSASSGGKKGGPPKLALELSGAGGQLADPYIVYKGWTLENGASKGTRLEFHLGGIMFGYELTAMSNTKACSEAGCLTGDFGSTSFHALEVGYRYRMGKIALLRPFITASLGAVRASAGDWAMQSGTGYGAVGRVAAGVELPIAGRFFASGAIGYRMFVTENPYRSNELDTVNAAFIGSEKPNGDYVDDAHVIGVNLGVGISL